VRGREGVSLTCIKDAACCRAHHLARIRLVSSISRPSAGRKPRFFFIGLMLVNLVAYAGEEIGAPRRAELVRLVRNDCGSCHGLQLTGGLGPALVPQTLAGKPAAFLRETILLGRAGTAMPPWAAFMNETEVDWIVEQLQKGFPDAR